MSFLSSVLETKQEVTMEHIKTRVPQLSAEVISFNGTVNKYFEKVYNQYREHPKPMKYLTTCGEIVNEINVLQKDIADVLSRQVPAANFELFDHKQRISEAHIAIELLSNVIEVHEALTKAKDSLSSKNYISAVDELLRIKLFLELLPEDSKLSAIEHLYRNICDCGVNLVSSMDNIFKTNVTWSKTITDNNVKNSLKVLEHNEEMKNALVAYYKYNSSQGNNIEELTCLVKFIWESLLTPIVKNKVSLTVDDGIVVKYVNNDSSKNEDYKVVLAQILELFNRLYACANYKLEDNFTFIQYIGRDVRDNLSELLIKHCLEATIPSSAKCLPEYNVVISETEQFCKQLVEIGVFTKDTTQVLDFVNNIDVHFINKKCEQYLQQANILIKSDLHDVVVIDKTVLPLPAVTFSRCAVSRSVIELMEHCQKILRLGEKSSDGKNLFKTVRHILYNYPTDVKNCHRELLATIPQQVAIFHNNCQYLAWSLSQSKDMFDVCQVLKDHGSRALAKTVKEQSAQVVATLHTSDLNKLKTDEENWDSRQVEKVIRQCLRQQELLKAVWKNVLTVECYNEALGDVLNNMCSEIINYIVTVEDLSARSAEQLVYILKIVLTRAPKLFEGELNSVVECVVSWRKLEGLVFILHASMADISEKWQSSDLLKGFKALEVRGLIKAIFQNSDRRAVILANFHD